MSVWRVVVVGSVAVLAIAIGVAAASFIATSRAAAIGSGASYVPASAPLYLELRIEPSAPQDEALRELLARFPPIEGLDLGRPLSDQLAELIDEVLADDGRSVRWADDVAPWIDGSLAFALLELPAAAFDPMADPMAMPETPPMVFLVGVSDAAVARVSVERLIGEADGQPVTFSTSEHRGVTIHVADGTDAGAYAITDDQLILAPTADDIVLTLEARATGATLGVRDEVTRLTAALPRDWLAFGLFDFTDAMAAALAAADDSRATSAALARILEHQTMRSAFTVTAGGDGLAFDAVGEPPTGPFGVENAARGLADEVPGDSLYYAEGGSVGPALAAVIGALKEAAAAEPEAAEALATAEAALGADLEELVAWIDDGAISIGWDGREPYGGMILVPGDRAAAERRLAQLATFAGLAALDPSSGITMGEADANGVPVTTITWSDPAMMPLPTDEPSALVLQYALTDARVIVGIGEGFVARALDLVPGDALSARARFVDAVAELGGPSSTGIGWMDIAGTLAAVEEAFGPMFEDATYRTEIRPWLAPLDRMVAVARIEDELLVQRSVLLVE